MKIDVLNEFDMENEEDDEAEGDGADADMTDPTAPAGTDLALMEEDDLLGDDLQLMQSPSHMIQDASVLTIEAGDTDGKKIDAVLDEKALPRVAKNSQGPNTQQGIQRRASPRITTKQAPQASVARARRGAKVASTKKSSSASGSQQKVMVDAKYPPHLHQ